VTRRDLLRLSAAGLASMAAAAQGQPPALVLGVRGERFTVDGAPRFLTMLSYFDGVRVDDPDADLAFVRRSLGFDGIRVLPNWWRYVRGSTPCPAAGDDTLFDGEGRIRGDGDVASGPLAALHRLLRAARTHGLVVDLSFTRETIAGQLAVDAYARALQRAAFLLREHRHVIVDLQNEHDLARPAMHLTPEEVRRLRDAVKDPVKGDPNRLVLASTSGETRPTGTVALATSAQLDAVAQHDRRRPGWSDQTTAVVTALRRAGRPVYLQEPTRWRLATKACGQPEDGDSDGDPAHFRTALRLARAAGAAAWTFHTQRTFRLRGPSASLRHQIEALPANSVERALLLGDSRTPRLTSTQ
jgi:hypothetical protein